MSLPGVDCDNLFPSRNAKEWGRSWGVQFSSTVGVNMSVNGVLNKQVDLGAWHYNSMKHKRKLRYKREAKARTWMSGKGVWMILSGDLEKQAWHYWALFRGREKAWASSSATPIDRIGKKALCSYGAHSSLTLAQATSYNIGKEGGPCLRPWSFGTERQFGIILSPISWPLTAIHSFIYSSVPGSPWGLDSTQEIHISDGSRFKDKILAKNKEVQGKTAYSFSFYLNSLFLNERWWGIAKFHGTGVLISRSRQDSVPLIFFLAGTHNY